VHNDSNRQRERERERERESYPRELARECPNAYRAKANADLTATLCNNTKTKKQIKQLLYQQENQLGDATRIDDKE
jgi:hypothetical protein